MLPKVKITCKFRVIFSMDRLYDLLKQTERVQKYVTEIK